MSSLKGLKKILVAIDGSEASIHAANYASDIADRGDSCCTLYFLHIIPPKMPAAQSSGYFGIPPKMPAGAVPMDYQKEIRQKAYEWFDRISAKVPKKDHIHMIKKVISTGTSIVAEITNYADGNQIELVVVGATGKSGLRRLLLGSVSGGLVAHSNCSVLVVR